MPPEAPGGPRSAVACKRTQTLGNERKPSCLASCFARVQGHPELWAGRPAAGEPRRASAGQKPLPASCYYSSMAQYWITRAPRDRATKQRYASSSSPPDFEGRSPAGDVASMHACTASASAAVCCSSHACPICRSLCDPICVRNKECPDQSSFSYTSQWKCILPLHLRLLANFRLFWAILGAS